MVIELDPHVQSNDRSMPYPANHVQEHRDVPDNEPSFTHHHLPYFSRKLWIEQSHSKSTGGRVRGPRNFDPQSKIPRPAELYVPRVVIHQNKVNTNYSREKTNIGLQDLIPIPHNSHRSSSKNVEVFAVIPNVMLDQTIKPSLLQWSISRTLEG
ncbi:hypothetical protein TNCV_5049352 [Trichonephila clavipes]|nr:hypothetical protein TNCV_5049352 [Trichonephila clavipes]